MRQKRLGTAASPGHDVSTAAPHRHSINTAGIVLAGGKPARGVLLSGDLNPIGFVLEGRYKEDLIWSSSSTEMLLHAQAECCVVPRRL